MVPPWALEIRRLIPIILSRANRNIDAENTAYFVLDDMSDATREKIAELLAADSFDKSLMQYLPPQALPIIQRNPAWFQEFVGAMQDYLLGEEEPEGVSPVGDTEPEPEAPPFTGGVDSEPGERAGGEAPGE